MCSLLQTSKRHIAIELIKYYQKYRPIFTFWIGPSPSIFICDNEIGREVLKRNELTGRPSGIFREFFSNEKYSHVFSAEYGQRWDILRRVALSAVRKYSVNDKLAYLISDIVDDNVKKMIEKNGNNKPFITFTPIDLIFFNVLVSSAFGKRYSIDDPEFLYVKYDMSEMFQDEGHKLAMMEFASFFKYFYRKIFKRFADVFPKAIAFLMKIHADHMKDYDNEIIRDYYDALINAKNEIIKENKDLEQYLGDESLAMQVFDSFFAGSHFQFKWIILLLANFPEIQNKMRQEIESVIGDRIPVQDDKNNLHYVNAFISETMRFKPMAPLSVHHKSLIETKIGDYKIPAETTVFIHLYSILNDSKYWTNPEVFDPNRFLENGKFISPKPSAFIPFGTGRRICLGEKIAINDMFLVLVRLLQSTHGYTISLINGPDSADLEPVSNTMDVFMPKNYEILLKKSD